MFRSVISRGSFLRCRKVAFSTISTLKWPTTRPSSLQIRPTISSRELLFRRWSSQQPSEAAPEQHNEGEKNEEDGNDDELIKVNGIYLYSSHLDDLVNTMVNNWVPPPNVNIPDQWSTDWRSNPLILSLFWLSPFYLAIPQFTMMVNVRFGLKGEPSCICWYQPESEDIPKPVDENAEPDPRSAIEGARIVFTLSEDPETYYFLNASLHKIYRINTDLETFLNNPTPSAMQELHPAPRGEEAIGLIMDRNPAVIDILEKEFLPYRPGETTEDFENLAQGILPEDFPPADAKAIKEYNLRSIPPRNIIPALDKDLDAMDAYAKNVFKVFREAIDPEGSRKDADILYDLYQGEMPFKLVGPTAEQRVALEEALTSEDFDHEEMETLQNTLDPHRRLHKVDIVWMLYGQTPDINGNEDADANALLQHMSEEDREAFQKIRKEIDPEMKSTDAEIVEFLDQYISPTGEINEDFLKDGMLGVPDLSPERRTEVEELLKKMNADERSFVDQMRSSMAPKMDEVEFMAALQNIGPDFELGSASKNFAEAMKSFEDGRPLAEALSKGGLDGIESSEEFQAYVKDAEAALQREKSLNPKKKYVPLALTEEEEFKSLNPKIKPVGEGKAMLESNGQTFTPEELIRYTKGAEELMAQREERGEAPNSITAEELAVHLNIDKDIPQPEQHDISALLAERDRLKEAIEKASTEISSTKRGGVLSFLDTFKDDPETVDIQKLQEAQAHVDDLLKQVETTQRGIVMDVQEDILRRVAEFVREGDDDDFKKLVEDSEKKEQIGLGKRPSDK